MLPNKTNFKIPSPQDLRFAGKTVKETFPVMNMSCASCAVRTEKIVQSVEGVVSSSVNFATGSLTVEYNPDITNPPALKKSVQDGGYDLLIENKGSKAEDLELITEKRYQLLKNKVILAIILSLPVVLFGMFFMNIPYANELMWLFTTPVVLWLGKDFFVNAWKQAKHRSANMDTLVALSTGIAYLFSVFNMLYPEFWLQRGLEAHVYFEAAAVIITFILLGRLLEEKAKGNTSSAIKKLMGLQPMTVTLIDSTGAEMIVAIEKIGRAHV